MGNLWSISLVVTFVELLYRLWLKELDICGLKTCDFLPVGKSITCGKSTKDIILDYNTEVDMMKGFR